MYKFEVGYRRNVEVIVARILDNLCNCLLIQAVSTGFEPMTLCDAGAMLYQLSYEATQLGAGQFAGLNTLEKGFKKTILILG